MADTHIGSVEVLVELHGRGQVDRVQVFLTRLCLVAGAL